MDSKEDRQYSVGQDEAVASAGPASVADGGHRPIIIVILSKLEVGTFPVSIMGKGTSG
jgi:hypothetical protein